MKSYPIIYGEFFHKPNIRIPIKPTSIQWKVGVFFFFFVAYLYIYIYVYIYIPWEPTTFIFRGCNPYLGGLKLACFMVLGSKGIFVYIHGVIESWISPKVSGTFHLEVTESRLNFCGDLLT